MSGADPGVSFRPHMNPANFITSTGLAAGWAAGILAASQGTALAGWRLWLIAGLVMAAVAADLADGSVARRTGSAAHPFGHGLDSISDGITCTVPAGLAAYLAVLHRVPVAGFLAVLLWGLCVAWRLARYMVRGHQPYYVGCPAPLAALILVLLVALQAGAYPVLAAAFGLGALMVSTIRIPTLADAVTAVTRKERAHADDADALPAHPQASPVRVSR
jgi:CDP-diacylglycerol--serine O-phosphatidyltransferase